jgi:hypothetical protein
VDRPLWSSAARRRRPARRPVGSPPRLKRPLGRPVSAQHPGESYRHAVDARRPSAYGEGAATVLVRAVDGTVELLFHADLRTGAVLTFAQAAEVADALFAARKAAGT